MKLIIASHNHHKIEEFKEILEPYDFEVTSLIELDDFTEIEETGSTFEENALIKAKTISDKYGIFVLADDSGLVVPALNNEPGIYSSRYSGEPSDDARNNQKLLSNMQAMHGDERCAYFISHIIIYHPSGNYLSVEGRVDGLITEQPRGDSTFGYDPLFYYPPYKQTFAELSIEAKNKVSHRAVAIQKILDLLPNWLKEVSA